MSWQGLVAIWFAGLGLAGPPSVAVAAEITVFSTQTGGLVMVEKLELGAAAWRQRLTAEQFHVLREKGTEPAFSNPLHANHQPGLYRCAGCGLDLFRSSDKFDSGTGWPSFSAPVARENVALAEDNSFFSRRTEVLCPRCGGHLGHVFDDGPPPTGKRYCMNGAALVFVPAP